MRFRKIGLLIIPAGTLPLLLLLLFSLAALRLIPSTRFTALYYGYPLKGLTVVIDPGHGGIDPGVHFNEEILEKEVVLAVGLDLRRLLEQSGAAVVMTREVDEDVSRHFPESPLDRHQRDVRGRTKIINESGADLFISLHLNSVHDPSVRGPIAFYCNSRPENKLLAELIQKNINPVLTVNAKDHQLIHAHPKETGAYYILNEAVITGIILEMAFMTSPDDRALLKQDRYRNLLAQAIFMGIAEYFYARTD
jgi:N-acetylmuramoyl-L-alanine amidase